MALALAGFTAAPASAEKVTSLKAWDSDNLYYAKADLDGRVRPEREPRAVIDHVREGDWVRITCQIRGETAYGSDLWDRVDGYYVPDAYLRTYTSGTLDRAPTCSPPAPTSRPRSQILSDAGWIMNKTYSEFVAYKHSEGQTNNPWRFIWEDDGCSAPWWSKPLYSEAWSELFDDPCELHDFGYWNYGTHDGDGKALSPSEDTREWIDKRFRTEMERLCVARVHLGAARSDCIAHANVFYQAVRARGEGAFD